MNVEFEHLGNVNKEKLESFLIALKKEFEEARELKQTLGELRDVLRMQQIKQSTHINTYSDLDIAITHEYNVSMLQLRDRILRGIKDFFNDNQL